mgnify:CR=1 FL=1
MVALSARTWWIAVVCALAAFPPHAAGQTYPAKPVRFIVGFAPGGTNDFVARALAPKLSELLGQQVVVENRGGGNGAIATELLVRSLPDGYTLLMTSPGHVTNPFLTKVNYDPFKDFAHISLLAESVNLLVVHPSLPVRNVKELIALSRKRPGDLNYGSSGVGTSVHLSAELFQVMAGVKWVHVPYRGGALATTDMLAGQLQVYFGNLPQWIEYVRAGKLRALAVTGPKRSAVASEIPTVAESGLPGYEVTAWYGMSAPAATPRAIVDRLNQVVLQALKTPDVRERLVTAGADPAGNSPEQFTAFIQSESVKWGKVIKAAGIKAE